MDSVHGRQALTDLMLLFLLGLARGSNPLLAMAHFCCVDSVHARQVLADLFVVDVVVLLFCLPQRRLRATSNDDPVVARILLPPGGSRRI